MSEHRTWRERFRGHADQPPEPVFEPSADPTLLAFGHLFVESGLTSFDANKHLRTGALSPLYDCETETVRRPGQSPERFVVTWAPVWAGTEPVTGFRTGHDSAYLGTTLTVAMPPDERTDALLLLVTTPFVHLSGRRDGAMLLVQGAIDVGSDEFRFVELLPDSAPAIEFARRRAQSSQR